MEATNTTKQYLKNYDGGILLPFTTLDCILSDEESDITGAEAIISSILSKDDLLIYEKTAEHNGDQFIHQSNLSGDNLHMLGIYNDGEHNNFIKMHAISDDESSSNQYLGADGAIHTIGNGNGDDIDINQSSLRGLLSNTTNPTWFSGKVLFDSSSCSITLDPRLNADDFYVEGGFLRVRTADHVRQSQMIVDSNSNNPINIGKDNEADLIKFVNGVPTKSGATLGGTNKFVYLENGEFKASALNLLGVEISNQENQQVSIEDQAFAPVIVESGVFKNPSGKNYSLFGGDWTGTDPEHAYALYMRNGKFAVNPIDLGSGSQLIYLENGEFVESSITVGEENSNSAVRLVGGQFVTCDPVGSSEKAIYIDASGIFQEVSEMSPQYIKKPTGNNNCVLVSVNDTDNNNTITNKWSSLDDLMNTHIVGAEIDDDNVKARTLIARPTGAAEGKLKVGWEELPHSVKVEAENREDKAFYLTGVYSGPSVIAENDLVEAGVTSEENDSRKQLWNEYYDIENMLAKKLEVAASGIYPSAEGVSGESGNGNEAAAITGIYFKNRKLYQTSDERLKTFTSELKDDNDLLEHIATIKKGCFYWTSDNKQKLDIGVTAQTVEKYFPEIVDEDKGIKTVSYSKLGVIALAAIDKLNEKIKALEKEIEDLKNQK